MTPTVSQEINPASIHPASYPDFLARDHLREIQWDRFQKILRHAFENAPWYREQMVKSKVSLHDIRSLKDIAKLPFITKQDLRDTYPFGMFATPLEQTVRIHASSGTTGKPIVIAHTRDDLKVWQDGVLRSLLAYGVHSGDILQNAYGYGLFTGGLGIHYGGEALGLTVVPISGGNTERQIMLMRDFNVTVISCTPSYFVHLLGKAQEMGVDLRELPIRIGIFGAEPWTNEMRKRIEGEAGIKAYDIYGLTEISGPGVGGECYCQNGIHLFEDHFYPEIIDPDTLTPLPDGEEGELVFTTLDRYATPLIRYRTSDITRIIPEPCPCGRTIRRIAKISHRSDDMFIVRGVNVFPTQIEAALLAVEGTEVHYQIILTRDDGLDDVEVQIEVSSAVIGDTIREIEGFKKRVLHQIQSTVGIRVLVTLVQPGTIPRSEGKAKRVVDKRVM